MLGPNRWDKYDLLVAFEPGSLATGEWAYRWGQITPFRFIITPNTEDADIVFRDFNVLASRHPSEISPTDNGASVMSLRSDGSIDVVFIGVNPNSPNPSHTTLHEVGHALGFEDDPDADPHQTIFSYLEPKADVPQARDIEEIQSRYGASPQDNVISAGPGSGVIRGGLGNDWIFGHDGEDIIYGNQGNDTIRAGHRFYAVGNDLVYGEQDNDTVYGGQGDDIIIDYDFGSDLVYGNKGNDYIDVSNEEGNETIYGGQGDDTIYTGLSNPNPEIPDNPDWSLTVYGNLGYDVLTFRGNYHPSRFDNVTLVGVEEVRFDNYTIFM